MFSPPPVVATSQVRGRGLAILASTSILRQNRLRMERQAYHASPHFEILIVSIGETLIMSAYIFCQSPSKVAIDALIGYIQAFHNDYPSKSIVLTGDFNHPSHNHYLHDRLHSSLGLSAVLRPGIPTRHASMNPLDNIFYSPRLQLGPGLVSPPIFGDHHMVHGNATIMLTPPPASGSRPNPGSTTPTREPEVIDWRPLNFTSNATYREMNLQKLALLTEAISSIPLPTALASLNDTLLATARATLGQRRLRDGRRHPWMSDRRLRPYLDKYRRAFRAYNARKTTRRLLLLQHATKNFKQAKRAAIATAKASYLKKLEGGALQLFFHIFKKERKPRQTGDNPVLSKAQTIHFWQGLFTRPAGDYIPISSHPPIVNDDQINILISKGDVADAIKASQVKASGPDGLDMRLIKACKEELAPLLAHAFTQALVDLPSSMKRGRTTLINKTTPPSPDPSKYRPITVLPVLTRLFLKVVDMKLRELLLDNPEMIHLSQAGFLPHRSTHEQATILHMLTAYFRDTPNPAKRLLLGAFLDIEKAFDTLPHEELIDVLKITIKLPPVWVEIIRRLLLNNTTEILGDIIAITRGCLQGSPLSPLLCLFMIQDLCAYLMQQGPPPSLLLHGRNFIDSTHLWLQLSQLLFCDDIAQLAMSYRDLQWYLTHTGNWATKRGIKLSTKSVAMILSASPASLQQILDGPKLTIQGLELPWVKEFTYLGHPTQQYSKGLRKDHKYDPRDLPQLRKRLYALNQVFTAASDIRIYSIRLLIIGIKQIVHAKALYHAAVQPIKSDLLDHLINPWLKQALQLPPDTCNAFLSWEVQLLPTHLYEHMRVLQFAPTFFKSWFFTDILDPLRKRRLEGYNLLATQHGPVKRILHILNLYNVTIDQAIHGTPPPAYKATNWSAWIKTLINHAFCQHLATKLSSYPLSYQTHYRRVCKGFAQIMPSTETTGKPPGHPCHPYIRFAGDLARVGLRFKNYSLRRLDQPRSDNDRPLCLWCYQHPECGTHLLECVHMPPLLQQKIDPILLTITRDATLVLHPEAIIPPQLRAFLFECLVQLYWPTMSSPALQKVLTFLGQCINQYRKSWMPPADSPNMQNPIWPVQLYTNTAFPTQ